ncbi:hypothetical protein ABPG72_008232 [Tetrahymena utriculariae]
MRIKVRKQTIQAVQNVYFVSFFLQKQILKNTQEDIFMQTERQNGKLQMRILQLNLSKAFMQLNKIIIIIDRGKIFKKVQSEIVSKIKDLLVCFNEKIINPFKEANQQSIYLIFTITYLKFYKELQQENQERQTYFYKNRRQLLRKKELIDWCFLKLFCLRWLQKYKQVVGYRFKWKST